MRTSLDENGKRCLTDLCVNVIIPCNIFRSCLIWFDAEIFCACTRLFCPLSFCRYSAWRSTRCCSTDIPRQRKKVLQYCTIVPMSGFLRNPIAEGIYDELGVFYTLIFLIPMRIVMRSAGSAYFTADETADRNKVLKTAATHPCLATVYLGLFCMATQIPLPSMVTEAVRYIGNCNSALTMFIVGTILADVRPSAIFAARYHSDAAFATQCVVITTLGSMLSAVCQLIMTAPNTFEPTPRKVKPVTLSIFYTILVLNVPAPSGAGRISVTWRTPGRGRSRSGLGCRSERGKTGCSRCRW